MIPTGPVQSDIQSLYNSVRQHTEDVALFGSFTRGTDQPNDIDFLVQAPSERHEAIQQKIDSVETQLPVLNVETEFYKQSADERIPLGYDILIVSKGDRRTFDRINDDPVVSIEG